MSQQVIGLLTRLYELERRLAGIERALQETRRELVELSEAKQFLREHRARRVYRSYAGRLLIEIEAGKALEIIEEEEKLLEIKASKLEEERKKLIREIEELRKTISLATKTPL